MKSFKEFLNEQSILDEAKINVSKVGDYMDKYLKSKAPELQLRMNDGIDMKNDDEKTIWFEVMTRDEKHIKFKYRWFVLDIKKDATEFIVGFGDTGFKEHTSKQKTLDSALNYIIELVKGWNK